MPFLPNQLPNRNGQTLIWPTGQAQIYEVPDNAVALLIAVCGPGGTGGNGFTRAAGAAGGGGGGGSCGGFSRVIVPAIILPRVIYANPGVPGVLSWIGVAPTNSNATNIATATQGGNGGNGTGAAVGAAGTAPGALAIANHIYSWMGVHEYNGGQAGAAGGAVAGAAGANSLWGSFGIGGGAGGGGTTSADFAGGNITGAGIVPTISGGAAGSSNGNPGYWREDLLISTGGSGGGSSNTGVGGNGGNGGPGSGGGGGGAGTAGGTGGRGGNGFVFILPIIS